MVDDRLPNIRTALEMGMETVAVGHEDHIPGAKTIPDIYSIARVVY